jgi:hypothetical protein
MAFWGRPSRHCVGKVQKTECHMIIPAFCMNIIRTRTYTRFKVTLVIFVLCWRGTSMLSKQHGDRQVCRRNTFVNRGTACLSQGCHGTGIACLSQCYQGVARLFRIGQRHRIHSVQGVVLDVNLN